MVREAVVLAVIGAATGLCAGVIARPFVAGVVGDASTGPVRSAGRSRCCSLSFQPPRGLRLAVPAASNQQ
jgi:hypothetical protein